MTSILIALGSALISLIALFFYFKMKKERDNQKAEYIKLLSQKKSSEIVLGQVAEKLVPFTDLFDHDPQRASFLGNPIDFVVFEDDEIVFIEVKSGRSRLTSKQRKIKKLVEDKKVRWEEIKIEPNK